MKWEEWTGNWKQCGYNPSLSYRSPAQNPENQHGEKQLNTVFASPLRRGSGPQPSVLHPILRVFSCSLLACLWPQGDNLVDGAQECFMYFPVSLPWLTKEATYKPSREKNQPSLHLPLLLEVRAATKISTRNQAQEFIMKASGLYLDIHGPVQFHSPPHPLLKKSSISNHYKGSPQQTKIMWHVTV